jgi:hypothetical protein
MFGVSAQWLKYFTKNRTSLNKFWCIMMYFVFLKNFESFYDEFIPIESLRIAPLGIYTNRKDIPRYLTNYSHQYHDYLLNFIFNETAENRSNNRDQDRI